MRVFVSLVIVVRGGREEIVLESRLCHGARDGRTRKRSQAGSPPTRRDWQTKKDTGCGRSCQLRAESVNAELTLLFLLPDWRVVNANLGELVWRGIEDANPWWRTATVPALRTAKFRRHAFKTIYETFRATDLGRGIVVLGPRRVGKTVIVHQVVEQLIADGASPHDICFLALDDVALRERELGELLDLVEVRRPREEGRIRYLLLDEVQHSRNWSGWLKRIADRREPYVFFATGSSATALRHGGQDAGLGRWREMTLFPWSFREHVQLRNLPSWNFSFYDQVSSIPGGPDYAGRLTHLLKELGPPPPDEASRLEAALVDYFLRGGFPEAAMATDLAEARRRLRQDILDRALGRDVLDVVSLDPRLLERMFLRICLAPGGLWNEAEVSRDLAISRPTVAKYLNVLERAFLVFRLPNLAAPVKGQPKVYLVAPALRQALLALDESMVRAPEEWGRLVENAVAATIVGARPNASSIGFWRKPADECDVVVLEPPFSTEYIEVKRSGKRAVQGIVRAADALGRQGAMGWVLCREDAGPMLQSHDPLVVRESAASYLYRQSASAGGTLRIGAV